MSGVTCAEIHEAIRLCQGKVCGNDGCLQHDGSAVAVAPAELSERAGQSAV